MANTAHVYKSKSGNWNVSFHHPICREGSIGKKIHRSLKVSDESEAHALREQINALLALAETPSLLPTRSHAIAERKYAPVIIGAFFDCMAPEPVDYQALRDREMPLPPKKRKQHTVPGVGRWAYRGGQESVHSASPANYARKFSDAGSRSNDRG
jgi:hypothetical protein